MGCVGSNALNMPEERHGLTAQQAGACGAAGLGVPGQQPQGECLAGPVTGELGHGSGHWRAGGDVGPSGGKAVLWEPTTAREWGWVGDGPGERRDWDTAVLWPQAGEAPSFMLQDGFASGTGLGPLVFILLCLRQCAQISYTLHFSPP